MITSLAIQLAVDYAHVKVLPGAENGVFNNNHHEYLEEKRRNTLE